MGRKTSMNALRNPCYQRLCEGLKAFKSFKNFKNFKENFEKNEKQG